MRARSSSARGARAIAGGALVVLAAAIGGWGIAERAHAPGGPATITTPVHVAALSEADGARSVERIAISAAGDDGRAIDAGAVLSRPASCSAQRCAVVVIVAGRHADARIVDAIGAAAGDTAVLSFEWPPALRDARGLRAWLGLPHALAAARGIPTSLARLLAWSAQQPWADPTRISVVGISLGSVAVPAALTRAATEGIRVHALVLAYGGAPLGALVRANPRLGPPWLRDVLADIVGPSLRELEPLDALPRLAMPVLVIEGSDDRLVPAAARAALWQSIRAPKTRVVLDGGHIGGVRDTAAVQRLVALVGSWLAVGPERTPTPS